MERIPVSGSWIHGRQPGDTMFCNTKVGFKYRMSSMQAALGLAQLERIEELIVKKREIFAWYRDGLLLASRGFGHAGLRWL
jgi:dTDP-4-amino-4,6-dideoxygalactose transaminase